MYRESIIQTIDDLNIDIVQLEEGLVTFVRDNNIISPRGFLSINYLEDCMSFLCTEEDGTISIFNENLKQRLRPHEYTIIDTIENHNLYIIQHTKGYVNIFDYKKCKICNNNQMVSVAYDKETDLFTVDTGRLMKTVPLSAINNRK